jgi:hypothetical protein
MRDAMRRRRRPAAEENLREAVALVTLIEM